MNSSYVEQRTTWARQAAAWGIPLRYQLAYVRARDMSGSSSCVSVRCSRRASRRSTELRAGTGVPSSVAAALEQVRGQVLRQKLDGVTDFFELMHIGARAKLELLTRCPYLLEFSIRAFYSRGEAVSDAVQARLNGDLTGSFAQYFSNIDFSKFRPGVDPAQLLRMLTWMTEGYMNEKQRAGVPLRLEDILADYSGWEEMFRKIAYKEEYL